MNIKIPSKGQIADFKSNNKNGCLGSLIVIGLIVLVSFSSFNNENESRWIGHTIINSPFKQTCLVKIIEASSRDEAELKFDLYISDMEKELSMKQRDKTAYAVAPLKQAIKIEHELKGFQP